MDIKMISKLFNTKKFEFKKPEIDRKDVGKELKERIIILDAECSILLQVRDTDGARFITFCDDLNELCYINIGSKTGNASYHIYPFEDDDGFDHAFLTKEKFFEFLEKQKPKLIEWFLWNLI